MVKSATKSSQATISLDHALEQVSAGFSEATLPDNLSFGFHWNNLQWHLNAQELDGAFSLSLQACLGLIPFTAEDSHRRQAALQSLLDWPPAENNRLSVNREGTVTLSLEGRFEDDHHIGNLMMAALLMLIGIKDSAANLAGNLIPNPRKETAGKKRAA